MSSFVLDQGESDGNKKLWSGKLVLLSWCSVRAESGRNRLAFLGYMEGMPPSD